MESMQFLYPEKISFRNEDKIKIFSDEIKLKVSLPVDLTIRNAKGSSSGWRWIILGGYLCLFKRTNNIKIVNVKEYIFFAPFLLISLYKSQNYLKKNYNGAIWFITNVDVLHIIIITKIMGAYGTNGVMVSIFYFSGTI